MNIVKKTCIFIGCLALLGSPCYAKEYADLQQYVDCGLSNCTLEADINELPLTHSAKQFIKDLTHNELAEALSPLPQGILDIDYEVKDKEKLIIKVDIAMGSQNYINWTFSDLILNEWYNSTWNRCNNLTINGSSPYPYVDEWTEKNLTNLTFSSTDEVRIINTSCFGTNGTQQYIDYYSSTTTSVEVGFYANCSSPPCVWSVIHDASGVEPPAYTTVFAKANSTWVNTSLHGSVSEYVANSHVNGGTYAGSWSLINSTGAVLDGTDHKCFISFQDGGYSLNAVPTLTVTREGNLSYCIRENITAYAIDMELCFYKNKMTAEMTDADSGQASRNIYNLGAGGTGLLNNTSNVLVNTSGNGGAPLLRGENWTGAYVMDFEYTIGHFGKDLGDCLDSRFYWGSTYLPMASLGSDYDNTCYPVEDTSTIEWRILPYDTGETGLMRYAQPLHEAYWNFMLPLNVTQGGEETEGELPTVYEPIIDSTIVCFETQPICINSRDMSIIYRGSDVYG